MNMFQAMGAMRNPRGFMRQQTASFSQQAMQQAANQLIQQNPVAWQKAQETYGNMPKEQMIKELEQEYSKQGQDLYKVAAQLGITI